MKNVIEFPQNKNKNMKNSEQNRAAKNAAVTLSMIGLIMGAILLNDSVQKKNSIYIISDNKGAEPRSKDQRSIASAEPLNPYRDYQWEKELAERLSKDLQQRSPASVKPAVVNPIDELRFGILQGKYSITQVTTSEGSKISEISYTDSDDISSQPLAINPDDFFKAFGHQLPVSFNSFIRSNPASQQLIQEYVLKDGPRVNGTVAFNYNDQGYLVNMKFVPNPEK